MPAKIGVIINNIGTPKDPSPKSVGKYLTQFLMDPGVIRLPWLFRFLLVRGLIVPFRSRSSAKKYQKIWTPKGSPLLLNTEEFAHRLQNALGDSFQIEVGMNFGEPSLGSAISKLKECQKIVFCPMFPQFDQSTTQGAIDLFKCELKKSKLNIPVSYLPPFYQLPEFIQSFATQIEQLPQKSYVLFSFHGLPEKYLDCKPACGNFENCPSCYRSQCYSTARLIAERAQLSPKQWSVSFQSRLGPSEWLKPYTEQEVARLQQEGFTDLVIASPAFVADCLETLEELGIEVRDQFLQQGGVNYQVLQCPNAEPEWVLGFARYLKMNL